jgi:hypothetical protein
MRREIQMSISCRDCVRQSTPDCDDCLVSYVLGETPDELTMTSDEVAITEMLTTEGLMPRLRFVSQSSDYEESSAR